jgi:hypothetical protein
MLMRLATQEGEAYAQHMHLSIYRWRSPGFMCLQFQHMSGSNDPVD